MKKYQYLLFDWDGCLADTLGIWMKWYKKIFKQYGLEPTEKEIVKKAFGDWEGPKKFGIKDSKTFMKILVDEVNKELQFVQLHQSVKEVWENLKQKDKKIAIVTSSKKSSVFPAIKNLHVEHLFDIFLGEEDVIKFKPDPEIIDKAINLLNGNKEQTLIVGDSVKDVQAGKNAGVSTLIFYPKANRIFYDKKVILETRPDYFIEDFRELLEIVS